MRRRRKNQFARRLIFIEERGGSAGGLEVHGAVELVVLPDQGLILVAGHIGGGLVGIGHDLLEGGVLKGRGAGVTQDLHDLVWGVGGDAQAIS